MTLLTQYKEFVILVGNLLIAIVFLLIGYAMGRNSADKPIIAVKAPEPEKSPPFHDDMPSIYDEALRPDPGKRIKTV